MEECVKDDLRDAMGSLKALRCAEGKANYAMNEAIGAINRLERENRDLRAAVDRLQPERETCYITKFLNADPYRCSHCNVILHRAISPHEMEEIRGSGRDIAFPNYCPNCGRKVLKW